MRSLLLLLLIPSILSADGTKEKKKKRKIGPGEIEFLDPGTPIEDTAVANREVARFQGEFKAAQNGEQRIQALQRLGKWDHASVYKAAVKYIKHKDHTVAVAAILACARQSKAGPKRVGKAFLGQLKREKRTDVICALLVGMGKVGFSDKNAIRAAKSEFRKGWKHRHIAATRYFGYIKYKPSFRMLAEVLDEPAPKRPDDPNNPPASYWKERWFQWSAAVPHTRWALSQLVDGETFDQTAEAKEWAETEGRKHGIKW